MEYAANFIRCISKNQIYRYWKISPKRIIYSIRIALTEDMSEIVWESDILASLPYTLTPGDVNLDFDSIYFVQAQAYQESAPFGDIGTVFRFTTGNQPGADEQPEMTVTF